MSDYQPFGYQEEPGTCLWCGRKLRHVKVIDKALEERLRGEGKSHRDTYEGSLVRATNGGRYQDDTFCGLRCGYQFGRRAAMLGFKLRSSR